MTRFLCTGDSHIGKGIGLYPERLDEQQQVWAATLELARELDVDAVLHAGDLFDQRRPGPDVMLAAERPLVEHSAADGCPVVVVAGNHDVPSQDGPCGLDVLAEAGLIELGRVPNLRRAGWSPGRARVAVLPWTPIGRLLANADPADRSETHALAADLLVESARELRLREDGPMVLLAHWSVSGSALPNGMAVAQVSETVLPLERLQQLGFDAVVLGHIHRPQHLLVADERDRPIFYVGSPMPLDHGEASCEHGVWVLEVGKGATFHPLPSRRFVTADYTNTTIFPSLDGAIVRAVFKLPAGANPPDVAAVREKLIADGAHVVTGVHVEIEREERQRAAVTEDITPEEALAAWLEHRGINGQVGADVTERARLYLEGARG